MRSREYECIYSGYIRRPLILSRISLLAWYYGDCVAEAARIQAITHSRRKELSKSPVHNSSFWSRVGVQKIAPDFDYD